MLIAIFSWFFYAIALVLKAYANRVRFMAVHEMPLAFSRSPGFASKFWLTRLIITYGSLTGLWFAYGMRVLVGAFLFYILFCMFTFIKGSRRSVNKWARIDFERQKQEATEHGKNFDEQAGWFNATKGAEKLVEEQISRNGNL
jgi:hypothetical protein